MKKAEQKKFVKNLTTSIAEDICQSIDKNKIPENWDGWELRNLIAEKFNFENMLKDKFRGNRRRQKDCNNTIIVNNL